MADEFTPTPAPFNEDALGARIRGEVRGALGEFAQQAQQQNQQRQAAQQQQQVAQGQASDPIYQAVVKPYLEPAVRALTLQSQAAIDAVNFYGQHPEAGRYRPQIESNFNRLASQGTPFDRQTVYDHFRGQNFEHFAQEQARNVQDAAARGATVGASGIGRPDQSFNLEHFRSLPLEEKRRALDNVTF